MSGSLKPFQRLVTTQSDNDLFIRKMQDPENELLVLSEAQQKKLDRMLVCKDYIKKKGSRAAVVPLLMSEFDCSRAEGYRIYNDTLEVFDVVSETKGRDIWIDILIGNIMDDRNKAVADKDFKTAAYCDKLLMDAIEKFFGGHDAKKYASLQPPNVTYVYKEIKIKTMDPAELDKAIAELKTPKERKPDVFDDTEFTDEEHNTPEDDK